MVEMTTASCDYCNDTVLFRREEIGPGPFTELVPTEEGSGSDHLATWCVNCGPRHRFPETVARKLWPYLWDVSEFEANLAQLPIFTPEQAKESAEKKRREKTALVARVLEAAEECR